jgi:hypothetical protein
MKNEKNLGKSLTSISITLIMILSVLTILPSSGAIPVGTSDNGKLVEDWRYNMQSLYTNMMFGSSSCIADLGVNNVGGEPNSDLEIIVGSDEYVNFYPELGATAAGIWRVLDSQGNLEWAIDTGTDESRSSPTVADLNGDGHLEIIGGTTSGWNVEVMDRFGNFVWTFPWPPQPGGPFMWHSSPAIAEVDPNVDGLEVFIGNNPEMSVWALDGDNSDGVDDGITALDPWIYGGVEGVDWDVLWTFQTNGIVYSTPALGDVDNDGGIEVVIGSGDGNIYVLDGVSGALEYCHGTGGAVHASAAIANLDGDSYLEIVMGSGDGDIYCLQWDGVVGSVEWTYTTGAAVFSSAAIGDIDNDGNLEIVDASTNGDVFALDSSGMIEWIYSTGSYMVSSPALASGFCVCPYDADWPMFRHDRERTGFYGACSGPFGLDIYIGSYDHYLYLIDGGGGGGAGGTLIDRFLTYGQLYTSPSVADIDGDRKLEIVFYDSWPGHNYRYTYWCIELNIEVVLFDIKPGSCPNPIDLKKKGVTPAAICGTEDFSVLDIDPTTVKLGREGYGEIDPIRCNLEDVATPYMNNCEDCNCDDRNDCHDLKEDGIIDMTLKFSTQEIVSTLLSDSTAGDVLCLYITGNTFDGITFYGKDVIWIPPSREKTNENTIERTLPIYLTIISFLQQHPNIFPILRYLLGL